MLPSAPQRCSAGGASVAGGSGVGVPPALPQRVHHRTTASSTTTARLQPRAQSGDADMQGRRAAPSAGDASAGAAGSYKARLAIAAAAQSMLALPEVNDRQKPAASASSPPPPAPARLPAQPTHSPLPTHSPSATPRALPVAARASAAAMKPLQAAASPASRPSLGTPGAIRSIPAEAGSMQQQERPTDEDFAWAQDDYNVVTRTVDTWAFFVLFRLRLWLLDKKWAYAGGFSEEKRGEAARSLARFLLESVLGLGPTFIKLGQLSSTRSDLFPAEFVEELSKLQDRVPAFPIEKARAIVEADLGQPLEKLYKEFDPRPIAAASLGQVHRATLWSGEQVVVKIQRPGLKKLFDIDLKNLQLLAEQLDRQDETNRDFRGIYQECAQVLYEEIDYINEGKNADRFRRNFADIPWVKVPIVHWECTSPRVITLEYLPGTKISSKDALLASGLDVDLISRRATEAYLIQILKTGFFHADPHPGNVSVDAQGNLIYYDMGMMGEIKGDVRERLLEMFYGIYRKDTNAVIKALTDLGVLKLTGGDALGIKRAINYFIDNLSRQTERQETIAAIGEDLFSIAVDQPFRFPATFTFVLRAFSTLEGIGKGLNPTYNFSEVATPYAQELLQLQDAQSRNSLLVNQLQQQASELGSAAASMPLRISRMDAFLTSIEAGDTKLRVRALETERFARRSGIMQSATLNAVGALGFTNLAVSLALGGLDGPATGALGLAAVFTVVVLQQFRRVERLDKFEKDLKGG